MRQTIPYNNVTHDYQKVIHEFIAKLCDLVDDDLVMAYLTGSYARGDATDESDLDIFCIFNKINRNILEAVGFCTNNTSISYSKLPINTQSMSIFEYKSKYFENWSEFAVTELNSVLLYGQELSPEINLKEILEVDYKKKLADILMSARHYICVDKPKAKLTHDRISTFVLKPLMFALREERFCKIGVYPLTNYDLLNSYHDANKILVEYFLDKEKFETDIDLNHKETMMKIHDLISEMMEV